MDIPCSFGLEEDDINKRIPQKPGSIGDDLQA
jgi:hypothetical protein